MTILPKYYKPGRSGCPLPTVGCSSKPSKSESIPSKSEWLISGLGSSEVESAESAKSSESAESAESAESSESATLPSESSYGSSAFFSKLLSVDGI